MVSDTIDELRAHLANEVHRVDWQPLAAHAERGGLVLVDPRLDLVEVAVAVASDDSARVRQWMEAGHLTKPTREQADGWRDETDERFTIVIVQPYVLAQRDTSLPVNCRRQIGLSSHIKKIGIVPGIRSQRDIHTGMHHLREMPHMGNPHCHTRGCRRTVHRIGSRSGQ